MLADELRPRHLRARLMYFPDPLGAMKHVRRLLKPGGRAAFAVWGARSELRLGRNLPDRRCPRAIQRLPAVLPPRNRAYLSSEMQAAGLRDVEEVRISSQLPYEDDASALEAAFAGGPVALAYGRFDAATRSPLTPNTWPQYAAYSRGRLPHSRRVRRVHRQSSLSGRQRRVPVATVQARRPCWGGSRRRSSRCRQRDGRRGPIKERRLFSESGRIR